MSSDARRITMKHVGMGPSRRRVLVIGGPPYPQVGDILNDSGDKYKVVAVKRTRIVARFQIKGKKLIPEGDRHVM